MQEQVSQYIKIEDKIIGPLTIRQFVYIASGVAISGLLYLLFRPIVVAVLGPIILGFAGILAFYTVGGRPFLTYATAALKHAASPARFTWQHKHRRTTATAEFSVPQKGTDVLPPKLIEQREESLFQIAWQMDVGAAAKKPEPL